MAISIVPVSETCYSAFYSLVQSTRWGNPMLPVHYTSSLWGMVVLDGEQVVGGWVGTLRGNVRWVRWLAKSVYFDGYPVFSSEEWEIQYHEPLLAAVRAYARRSRLTMLNLTHWVRGNGMAIDAPATEATFCTDLHTTEEQLWQRVESKQRNCIRKAEKSGVVVEVYTGAEAMPYLSDFQRLRQATQQHAIHNHAQASMLLKSDSFFAAKFADPKATLFVAKAESQVAAVALMLQGGDTVWHGFCIYNNAAVALMLQGGDTVYYYSGGSDYDLNRKYCCSAFLLWRALCYYNGKGTACFDMGGVPVSPDKDHPAYGVYAFKRSFGGSYCEFTGGTVAIVAWKYRLLRFLLSQRKLLRLFSNKL